MCQAQLARHLPSYDGSGGPQCGMADARSRCTWWPGSHPALQPAGTHGQAPGATLVSIESGAVVGLFVLPGNSCVRRARAATPAPQGARRSSVGPPAWAGPPSVAVASRPSSRPARWISEGTVALLSAWAARAAALGRSRPPAMWSRWCVQPSRARQGREPAPRPTALAVGPPAGNECWIPPAPHAGLDACATPACC